MKHPLLACLLPSLVAGGAAAQTAAEAPVPAQAAPEEAASAGAAKSTLAACQADRLFPDAFGRRAALEAKGLCFGLTDTNETLGNTSGGVRRGAIYEGATLASIGVDLGAAGLWAGGTFNVSAWQLRGHGLSTNNLLNLNTASGIEATPAWRLFELWYQQNFAGDAISIRIGQMSSDTEFLTSQYAALFTNASFGWPTLPAADLPAGGSAFPLATPGVRVRVVPAETWVIQGGVFSGSPAGDKPGNPQLANRDGLLFPLGPGATWIAELQKTWRPFGLEGSWKFGGWYNTNRYSEIGSPDLAVEIAKSDNWSLYGVIDQLLWRPAGQEDGGIGGFLRAMGAPGDRNAVSFFIDAGLTWKGMIPGRADDTAGIGIGYAKVGSALRDAAAEQNALSPSFPRRGGEFIVEISYRAVVVPGWTLQPLVQYVARPGGGITDPTQEGPPYRRIGNETVLGLRSVMAF